MSYKTLLAAAALASLPMVASAVTIIQDNQTTTINSLSDLDNPYLFFVDTTTATDFTHTFQLGGALSGAGNAEVSLTTGLASLFNNLLLNWGGSSVAVTAGVTTANAVLGSGGSQTLTMTWDSAPKGLIFDGEVVIEIAAVPVPASLLLLGTAIGGLGLARRRKS